MPNWLNRKLTRKFLLLLAGFFVLQSLQLVVGITGFSHLSEEAAFINSTGKQRLRTVLLLTHTHALTHPVNSRADVHALGETMDSYAAFYQELDEFRSHRNWFDNRMDSGRVDIALDLLADSRNVWEQELHPLVAVVAMTPTVSQARQALVDIEGRIPAQLDRIDQAVKILEMDTHHNAQQMMVTVAALLGLSLLLGIAGFAMAHLIVTQPLRRLTAATRDIADGAYDHRVVATSQDELGELAEHFNRMAGAIELRSRRVWALNQAAATITSFTDLREILDRIMRHGVDVSQARAACVALYDEKECSFGIPQALGLSDAFVHNMRFLPGGLAEQVFRDGRPVVSSDGADSRYRPSRLVRDEGLRAFVCLPLATASERFGVIYFYLADRDDFTPDELSLLSGFANLTANAIVNARLYERVAAEARTDMLTGLRNRRSFDQRLAEEHSRSKRYEKPFALAMIDIDHFKKINDTYGHIAGDSVLKQFGRVLEMQFRDVDVVTRYGGEEFAVILPEISGGTAKGVAERVRRAIGSTPFALPDGSELGVTVSIGISCFPNCSTDPAGAILTADQALYVAKQTGRNRVMLYRETLKARIEKDPNLIPHLLVESLDNVLPIVTAISAKAPFLRPHSECVCNAALALARTLKLSPDEQETLRLAALLHDIGMLTLPDRVLAQSGQLKPEDWDLIKQHPVAGADLLAQVPALRDVSAIVRAHHERYDGKGYPDGLHAAELPRLARVLAVADAYGSMVSDWPGHTALPRDQAVNRLRAGAGTQFDPEMVELLLKSIAAEAG
jgi:diguanylate cyclase (GGDEF)-like protein/putative nucleotidyltransferase with HDIG domain